jgi:RNA polymerase sigma-70 factor (ECF subfamily)
MTDETLLAGLGAGDADAALAFVRRFQSHVYAVALAVVADPSVAEDVAQQAFERVWQRSSAFDPVQGTVRTWLTTITRRKAIDALKARRPVPIDPIDLIRLLGPAHHEPEAISIQNESRTQLQLALRKLPSEQARALVMAGVYRMSAQEVADVERIPLGTAKTRIRTAMAKLREHLASSEVSSHE